MQSKEDFIKMYQEKTPEERRQALDSMDMSDVHPDDDPVWDEHNALAELVAKDEETAAREIKDES